MEEFKFGISERGEIMREEEIVEKLKAFFNVDDETLHTAAAYDLITRTSLQLTALTIYLKKYEVMIPENCEKFHAIVKTYLEGLQEILNDEADIERLRGAC